MCTFNCYEVGGVHGLVGDGTVGEGGEVFVNEFVFVEMSCVFGGEGVD